MAKAKSVETKKPTGLTVTRAGNSFACAWKIGDADYGAGQWFKYRINGGSWTAWDKISSSATSKNISLGANMKTVVSFEFAVKGKRKKYKKTVKKKEVEYEPTSSTNTKVWKSTIPQIASFTYSRTSSNAGTFSWSVNVSDNDTAIFDHVVLETATMRSDAAPGAWSGSNQPASGSASYTETLSGSNLVRWARVKAVGPAGESGWMELHHAYGNPSMPSPAQCILEHCEQCHRRHGRLECSNVRAVPDRHDHHTICHGNSDRCKSVSAIRRVERCA
jgi:hypothetical protein